MPAKIKGEGDVETALRKGSYSNRRRHVKVAHEGETRVLITPTGPKHFITGTLTGEYWGSTILKVDFDRDRITDFGYANYSVTTNRRLDEWMGELQRLRAPNMLSLTPGWLPFAYTNIGRISGYARPSNTTRDKTARGMWKRFCEGVPWVVREHGYLWFDGQSYNSTTVQAYHNMKDEIIADSNWRYFTASWRDGLWTKHFIDDAARQSYERREARR